MVHFADASPNQVAILTGGAKNLGWPSPNVFRTAAAASSSGNVDLQGFDEAQAGFTPAMKQLVDSPTVEEVFRNTVERLRQVNNAGTDGSGRRPRNRGEITRQRQKRGLQPSFFEQQKHAPRRRHV